MRTPFASQHPFLLHLHIYYLDPFYPSRSTAFGGADWNAADCDQSLKKKNKKRKTLSGSSDKALWARREGTRGRAGRGERVVPHAEGRPPGVRTSEAIRLEFFSAFCERTAAAEFRKADSPDPDPGPRQLAPAARPARLRQDSASEEKAWIRKDAGEQRAFGRRRCYLIVCVIGGAAVGRMLWSFFSLLSPTPTSLPAVSAHAHAPLFTCFSLFSHSIFSPSPFLSSTLLSFLLSFLRRKASLSVFTADLDLNVHTIKARGECQEWGWLSTVDPRGPSEEGATEPGRLPQSSALRLQAGGVTGFRRLGCPNRSPWGAEMCGL